MRGPVSYVQLLDEVLQQDERTHPDLPLRPSNAGTCARRIAYDYAAYLGIIPWKPETKKTHVQRLLNLGHHIETQVVNDFKRMGGVQVKYTQQEVDIFTLPYGTEVLGHTDLGIFINEEGYAGLSDVKSMGDRWEAAYDSKWEKLIATYQACESATKFYENSFWVEDVQAFLQEIGTEDSLYKNIVQLNLYACTPFMVNKGIDHASILRYNKNNSKLMEIRFAPSQELFNSTYERFKTIEAVAQHQDPTKVPRERLLGHVDCVFCPYQKDCWPAAERKDLRAGGPKKKWATSTEALPNGPQIEEWLDLWEIAEKQGSKRAQLEEKIILALDKEGVTKVKAFNLVYEVKHLKSGSVLRRSKE